MPKRSERVLMEPVSKFRSACSESGWQSLGRLAADGSPRGRGRRLPVELLESRTHQHTTMSPSMDQDSLVLMLPPPQLLSVTQSDHDQTLGDKGKILQPPSPTLLVSRNGSRKTTHTTPPSLGAPSCKGAQAVWYWASCTPQDRRHIQGEGNGC